MTPHSKYFFAMLAAAALGMALPVSALTLGRAKGSAFLGQPLRLTVPVQMDVGEGPSALCFEADVFYGDTRQDSSRVSISSTLLPQTQSANVTVSVQVTVDEPVVTVYLRAGCEYKTTRRYTLLTEMAQPAAPQTGRVAPPMVSVAPPAEPAQRPTPSEQGAPKSARTVQASKSPAPQADAPATETVRATPPLAKPAKVPRRAHLRLAPLDLTVEQDPTLKFSVDMRVEDGEDPQRRARAVAMWRSLNATPQDILADESRQQAYATDLRNLQSLTVKNRQLLEAMAQRLDRAERERYANPLVYGLLAALAACALVLAWMVRRTRRTRRASAGHAPWWRDEGVADKPETVDSGFAAGRTDPLPASVLPQADTPADTAAVQTRQPPSTSIGKVDVDLAWGDAAYPSQARSSEPAGRNRPEEKPQRQAPARPAGHVDFGHSMSASLLRSVNSKEMLDVCQQAEFFMTLGQHEEAVALLRDSVDSGVDANPVVALELLKVLHTLGRKAEYDHYRQVFNTIFNGHVPVYADFSLPSSGLEAYPGVCKDIVALWPTDEAVAYIEACLVRTRKGSDGQDYDLEAFRDLLMLHGVANRIASSSLDSGLMAFSAPKSPELPNPDPVVDLDLSEPHNGNLIDFDASGWSMPPPTTPKN